MRASFIAVEHQWRTYPIHLSTVHHLLLRRLLPGGALKSYLAAMQDEGTQSMVWHPHNLHGQGGGWTRGHHHCLTHWYHSGGVVEQMDPSVRKLVAECAMLTQAPVHDVYDRRPRLTKIPGSSATPANGGWLLISDGLHAEPSLRLGPPKKVPTVSTGIRFCGTPGSLTRGKSYITCTYVGPRRQHPAKWRGRSTKVMGPNFLNWNGQHNQPPREGGKGRNVVCHKLHKLTVSQCDQSTID